MGRNVTIRDIAEKANVSLSSVHAALNNKSGVSQKTKNRILEIAKELDYHPNYAASTLKRKEIYIVGCFPDNKGDNRYYYTSIWKGFLDFCEEISRDMHLKTRECAYAAFGEEDNGESLKNLEELRQELRAGKVDGMILDGNTSPFSKDELNAYIKNGLTLVLTDRDIEGCTFLSCVHPNYTVIGKTIAEIITDWISPYGSILLLSGQEDIYSHQAIVNGFELYMAENHFENKVYKLHNQAINDNNYQKILEAVRRPDIAAAACVSSKTSVMLGRALEASGKAGKIVSIGSDIFEENKVWLKEGVYKALIQKNPYEQTYVAGKILMDGLLRDKLPEKSITVSSQVIFRSNLVEHNNKIHIIW